MEATVQNHSGNLIKCSIRRYDLILQGCGRVSVCYGTRLHTTGIFVDYTPTGAEESSRLFMRLGSQRIDVLAGDESRLARAVLDVLAADRKVRTLDEGLREDLVYISTSLDLIK